MPGKKKGAFAKKAKPKKVVKRASGMRTKPVVKFKGDERLLSTRQKVLAFLSLKETKRIAIISDNDEDGVTAAVQMKKFLDFSKVESQVFFYDHYSRKLSFPNEHFKKFSPEKTIFLDLGEAFISEVIEELGNATGPFLVIDHHQGDVIRGNAFRCMVIKPRSFSDIESSKYPASKMVHDLFLGIDWLCAIGVIGDFAFDEWKDFLKSVEKKHHLTRAKLNEIADLIACITSQYPEKINTFFASICSAKKPLDLLDTDFFALKKLFDKRLALLKELFKEKAEYYGDVGLYFFKSDPRFSAKLSNILSTEHKDKTIIVYEQPGDLLKCSMRRQDFKVNCNLLAKAGIVDIPYSKGGGHIPAAGAAFPPEYFEQFKRQVRIYLLNNPPKERLA